MHAKMVPNYIVACVKRAYKHIKYEVGQMCIIHSSHYIYIYNIYEAYSIGKAEYRISYVPTYPTCLVTLVHLISALLFCIVKGIINSQRAVFVHRRKV